MPDQSELATGTAAVAERPAEAAAAASSTTQPSGEGRPQTEGTSASGGTPDLDALLAKLTPEQRLKAAQMLDVDQLIRSGAVAAEVEKQRPQIAQQVRDLDDWQTLERQRDQAIANGDAVLALEILGKLQQRASAGAQQQQRDQIQGGAQSQRELAAAWEDTKTFFLSDAVPQPVKEKLGVVAWRPHRDTSPAWLELARTLKAIARNHADELRARREQAKGEA